MTKMKMNVNPETGVRYGVINGNRVEELLTEIMDNGVNEDFEAELEEWKEQHIGYTEDEFDEFIENRKEELEGAECEYTYTSPRTGAKYKLGWLGGAPIIWVLKSQVKVYARLCSPCIPNAGDLDELDRVSGVECYGIPDEDKDAEV